MNLSNNPIEYIVNPYQDIFLSNIFLGVYGFSYASECFQYFLR